MKFLVTLMCALWVLPAVSVGAHVDIPLYRKHPVLVRGDSVFALKKWNDAIRLYQEGKLEFENQGNQESYLYATNQIAACYLEQGDTSYQKKLDQAWSTADTSIFEEHFERARYYFIKGEFEILSNHPAKAESSFIKATNIWEKQVYPDLGVLTIIYQKLAKIFFDKGEFFQAASYYNDIIKLSPRSPFLEPEQQARIFFLLGRTFRAAQDIFRARDYLSQAEQIYRQNSNLDSVAFADCLLSLGNTFFDEGQFREAITYYLAVLSLVPKFESSLFLKILAMTNLGSAYSHMGQKDSAAFFFEEALARNQQRNSMEIVRLSETTMQYADHFQQFRDYQKADELFRASMHQYLRAEDPDESEISYIWQRLAQIAYERGRFIEGLQNLDSAILIHRQITEADLIHPCDAELELKADALYALLQTKALLTHGLYEQSDSNIYLDESIRCYKLLSKLMGVIRNGAYSDRTKLTISKYFRNVTEQALRSIFDLQKENPDESQVEFVLNLMEKTRYAELYGKLSRAQVRHEGLVPDSVYQKEIYNTSLVTSRQAQLAFLSDPERITHQQKLLFEARVAMQEFKDEVSRKYPAYFQVKYDDLLTIQDFQARLKQDEQIMEYFWGDSLLTLVSITPSVAKLNFIPITDSLTNWLKWTLQRISIRDDEKIASDYTSYSRVTNNLYQCILDTFIEPGSKHLIISPDGDLAYLPFDVLVTKTFKSSFRKAPYLLKDKLTQYEYSCNLLFKNPAGPALKDASLLAFAYSDEETKILPLHDNLNELPASYQEIRSIAEAFGKKNSILFHGKSARESSFKSQAKNSNIIHLALHGISDTINDARSHLVFRDDDENSENGKLYNYEIYNLDLSSTSLAVLSTCQSGIGKHIEGEGIFSIARAFMHTGIPAIVMSLWNADDQSTSDIMQQFHRYLARGKSISEALQKAKLYYLERSDFELRCQPYFWSTFIVLGDSSPIITYRNYTLFFIFLIIITIAVLLIRRQRFKPA